MHITTTTTQSKTPGCPLADGFLPGPPWHIQPETIAIDTRTCARMRCPKCSRRGLEFQAFHLGNRYRAVGECSGCGHSEEL